MNSFAGPTLFPSVSELTRCDTETLYSLSFLWSERGVVEQPFADPSD